MVLIALGFVLFTQLDLAHAVLVLLAVPRPAHDRRVAVDVADDRVDHVGGAREPRRRGLGDERRDA